MKDIVFATHNKGKLKEVSKMLSNHRVLGLTDIGCQKSIPETAITLRGNALLKANYVVSHYGLPCFSDDTGLEVEALNGAPGVWSARYAGEHATSDQNIEKLLQKLVSVAHRKAVFKTVIVLKTLTDTLYFEGVCQGTITCKKMGNQGFGYDPIFMPEKFQKTFAQMTIEEKSNSSHRGKAITQLMGYLGYF